MTSRIVDTMVRIPSVGKFEQEKVSLPRLLENAIGRIRFHLGDIVSWLDCVEGAGQNSSSRCALPKALPQIYGDIALADYLVSLLRPMDEDVRRRHFAISRTRSLAEMEDLLDSCVGMLWSLERRNRALFEAELDRQLVSMVDEWRGTLTESLKSGIELPQDAEDEYGEYGGDTRFDNVVGLCQHRTDLQHIVMGLMSQDGYTLKSAETDETPRLGSVSIGYFAHEVLEADALFRKLLNGKRDLRVFWFDRSFWWHRK